MQNALANATAATLANDRSFVFDGAQQNLTGVELCDGRIRVGRRIGVGGMGTVHEGWSRGQQLAIKFLSRATASQIYRLKNEFRNLVDIAHPNVVRVHELCVDRGDWFFTMELIEGLTLEQYFAQATVRPARAIFDVFRQIIEGVGAIHAAGLLHRDLKPSNILVERSGRVVIVDFGLAASQDVGGRGRTLEGCMCGTPGYMAPEQRLGRPVEQASDWYNVGVMLHEVLTGRSPPRSALCADPSGAPHRRWREHIPDLREHDMLALRELCLSLLRADPKRRPSGESLRALVRDWPRESRAARATPAVEVRLPHAVKAIGAQDVQDQLERAHRATVEGEGRAVLLSRLRGEARGAVLAEFQRTLERDSQTLFLRAQCSRRERVPYRALDGLIDNFTRYALRLSESDAAQLVPRHVQDVASAFPVLLRVGVFVRAVNRSMSPLAQDPSTRRRRIAEGLRDLLWRLSERQRLVLILEDTQWGDTESASLIEQLFTAPEPPPLLLLFVNADDTLPSWMGRATCFERLSLGTH